MKRRQCQFSLPGFETFCVRSAGHSGRHLDKYFRQVETCPHAHPRHHVVCVKKIHHKGPHTSGHFTWSNVR